MTAREAALRRQVVAYLRSLGPVVCWRSNPASGFGTAGDPDLFVCVGGALLCLELKRADWRPTPAWLTTAQARRLAAWAAAGAAVRVVTSKAAAVEAVESLFEGRLTHNAKGGNI